MTTLKKFFKDPGSAITHFIGMIGALLFTLPLISKSTDTIHALSFTIFAISMVLLYGASTTYHTFDISSKVNTILKKVDHLMIFILIAGSYTPVCLIVLHGKTGYILLSIVWGIAIVGMIVKSFFINCPKWFSSILYIAMGWTIVFAFAPLYNALTPQAFMWLLTGGIIYTIGGIIYALKLPIFNKNRKFFDSHVIFHLFVLGGSICHYIFMYSYVSLMPV